jgi:hypothetical protein
MRHWALRLLPAEHRGWGEAYVAEFGSAPGLVRVLTAAWIMRLRKGDIVRTVVVTTSVVNLAFGLFVVGLFLFTSSPFLVLVLGLGLVGQGAYTLWHLSGDAERPTWSTHLLLAGETVALLIGVGAFAISIVDNLDPLVSDREYGPMAAAGTIAAQAAATIYLYAIRHNAPSEVG